jgi:hypothetical protein
MTVAKYIVRRDIRATNGKDDKATIMAACKAAGLKVRMTVLRGNGLRINFNGPTMEQIADTLNGLGFLHASTRPFDARFSFNGYGEAFIRYRAREA